MTYSEASLAAQGDPIQRLAWVQAPTLPFSPSEWALGVCPGGTIVVLSREGCPLRYALAHEEILALDWRPVPTGQGREVRAYLASMWADGPNPPAGRRAFPRGL